MLILDPAYDTRGQLGDALVRSLASSRLREASLVESDNEGFNRPLRIQLLLLSLLRLSALLLLVRHMLRNRRHDSSSMSLLLLDELGTPRLVPLLSLRVAFGGFATEGVFGFLTCLEVRED